mgnify:CR=1 FL=1
MKRVLPSLILVLGISLSLFAQECTPDNSITEPGIYPSELDTAFMDVSYDFNFQILAIKDTAVTFGGQNLVATIDSVKVNEVIGLPSTFSYTCSPTNCVFTYEAVGCINVKGDPTVNDVGVHNLTIKTTVYANAGILKITVQDSIVGYQLIVKGDGTASVKNIADARISIYPNPSVSGRYTIANAQNIEVVYVTNTQGQVVNYKTINNKNSKTISLANLAHGVYWLHVKNGDTFEVKKLIH